VQHTGPDKGMTGSRPQRKYYPTRSKIERARFNGRSREGARLRMLERQFKAHLGEVANSPVAVLAVRRCAEIVMLAEVQRAKLIRGEDVDLSHLLRLEGVAARALAALGVPLTRRDTSQPSLADYLADLAGIDGGGDD
jgi:hypothetical protein